MTTSDITVWGIGTMRTLRIYWTLHEFELDYISRPIRARTSDMDAVEFLAVSPGKKIPAFQHGDLTITESGAITRYLFETFDLLPRTAAQNAKINRWSYFTLMEIDATALYVMRRHRDLPEIYGDAPVAINAAKTYFERQINLLNDELADDREFLVGDYLSEADIHLVTCCDWALHYDLQLPYFVAAYHTRQRKRPAYAEACAVNYSKP